VSKVDPMKLTLWHRHCRVRGPHFEVSDPAEQRFIFYVLFD
jgi:hypothetical protein